MEIESIEISNYRSIESLTIPIQKIGDRSCFILLGKNESGKSNILKAISLFSDETEYEYSKDCNKKARKREESILIKLQLKFSDYESYKKKFSEIGIPKELHSSINPYKVELIAEVNSDDDFKKYVHIWIDEKEIFSKYAFEPETSTFKLISEKYKEKEPITDEKIKSLFGNSYVLLEKIEVETLLESKLYRAISQNTPMPILWRPDEKYLINKSVDLEEFASNSKLSIPLKNIFKIAGIKDIEKRIQQVKEEIEERSQLKQELTNSITRHINEKWPEHKINILIEMEGMTCTVMVEDQDDSLPKYKMEQRSDGFQQFISILLNLSIESQTNEIVNKIILLDEPEIHLHPSGVRYLRDELLKISSKNIVMVASHSIYMVDKLNLDRHFKVTKERSVTSIKQTERDNPYEEEVIYEALGTSIFEHIQPNMLILEGKTDKDMFDGFIKKFKTDLKPVSLGTISADGVEKIPQYVKFMEGRLVKGFVIVDSDSAGQKMKSTVKDNSKSFNTKNTFEINDIVKTGKESTLEDLYPIDLVMAVISTKFNTQVELNPDEPVVRQLEKKNKDLKGKINLKELKGLLVKEIMKDISKLNKAETKKKYKLYYSFVEGLSNKLKS